MTPVRALLTPVRALLTPVRGLFERVTSHGSIVQRHDSLHWIPHCRHAYIVNSHQIDKNNNNNNIYSGNHIYKHMTLKIFKKTNEKQQWGAQESIKVKKITIAKRRMSPKSPKIH